LCVVVILLIFYPFNFTCSGSYFIKYVLSFVSGFSARFVAALFPFDAAKLRGFSELAILFMPLCAQTAPFVDAYQ
jgi:hypothetical protein